ncbi:hypothetical protein RhiirC2_796921 [Rhizophagus irregularis]|uniref:RRM domain-containing protein n=1 Tax=Rhizophagus irregularis TaxID=588596 RepID=A0A2N1M8V7_9GLOM|nr:hypothetical protein RhiirC2_796921 [Rhizophagus irregularis]
MRPIPCADLLDLVFALYSSADTRHSDEEKSLFVTDIPLFLNEIQIRQAFSRYGKVAIIYLGNSLRICPASYLKAQRDVRREHIAILVGIPKNIKEADLSEIALQVNAKAVNIPLSYNSYKPKPYAYLNFASFESLEAAKELTIAFRNKGLTWHSPDEAKNLCHSDRSNSGPSHAQLTARTSRSEATTSQRNPHAEAQSGSNVGPSSPPFSQPKSSLPPDVIEEIKKQLKDIAKQLKDLDKKVTWMEYFITDHNYRIKEFKSMMNYDGPQDDTPSYAPTSGILLGCSTSQF